MRSQILLFSFLLITSFWLTSCGEQVAKVDTPKIYKISEKLSFHYPENWEVTEDMADDEMHYIFIETPGDAIVIVQCYPLCEDSSLEHYAQEFATVAAEETPVIEVSPSKFSALTVNAGVRRIEESFSFSLLGESVPHRRIYQSKNCGEKEVYLILQVASEDYDKVIKGYELIQNSLFDLEESK